MHDGVGYWQESRCHRDVGSTSGVLVRRSELRFWRQCEWERECEDWEWRRSGEGGAGAGSCVCWIGERAAGIDGVSLHSDFAKECKAVEYNSSDNQCSLAFATAERL